MRSTARTALSARTVLLLVALVALSTAVARGHEHTRRVRSADGQRTVQLHRTRDALEALDPGVRERRRERAYTRMAQAGAHYVVDGIWDVPPLIDAINERLARGERP